MTNEHSLPRVEDAELRSVSGGAASATQIHGFANWFRGAGRWLGDRADAVLPAKPGPYTSFNNRGYDWGLAGEAIGRSLNKGLGISSGASAELSSFEGHSAPNKPL